MTFRKTTRSQPLRIVGVAADIEKSSVERQLGALWQRAARSGLLADGEPTYAVYTDYADRLGERYRVLVGIPSDAEPGPDQEILEVPAGSYAVFEGAGDPVPTVQQLWRDVWTKARLDRTFRVDFECYRGTADDAEVSLHIGIS